MWQLSFKNFKVPSEMGYLCPLTNEEEEIQSGEVIAYGPQERNKLWCEVTFLLQGHPMTGASLFCHWRLRCTQPFCCAIPILIWLEKQVSPVFWTETISVLMRLLWSSSERVAHYETTGAQILQSDQPHKSPLCSLLSLSYAYQYRKTF